MKLWIKYIIAAVIGYIFGAFIPFFRERFEWLEGISEFFFLALPWFLYPLIFFSVSSAVAFVRHQKQLKKLTGWSFLWAGLSHLLLALMGGFIAAQAAAVPVMPEFTALLPSFDPVESLRETLLLNRLPFWLVIVSGVILGLALKPEDSRYIQGYHTMNSFSEVFFRISRCVSEIITLGIIAFAALLVRQQEGISLLSQNYVLLFLTVLSSVIGMVLLLPLVAMLLCTRKHPYRWFLSLLAPVIASGISGSYQLGMLPLYGHSRTNVGAARSVTSVTTPFFAVFGRGGTAMVTTISAVTIISSQQGGSITPTQVTAAAGFSIFASLLAFLTPEMELPFSLFLVLLILGISPGAVIGVSIASILLKGAAASLDIMVNGMGTGYTAQKLDAEYPASWNDMQ